MICPDILEERLKDSLVLDLHVLLQNAEPAQHCLQVPPGQHRLNNIGPAKSGRVLVIQWRRAPKALPIKTVDAVGAEEAGLPHKEAAFPLLEEESLLLLYPSHSVHQD